MVTVHFTAVTTQWGPYISQWLNTIGTVHLTMFTQNGNCTLRHGYHIMETILCAMVTSQGELYTSQRLPHNGNCTLHRVYQTMGTVHFTRVTTQWKLYTSQSLPHNYNCTPHNGYHTIVTVRFAMVTTE